MERKRTRVWDVPMRLIHWGLAGTFLLAWTVPGEHPWHHLGGYLFSLLLLFRVVWGFIGGRYARFDDLLRESLLLPAHFRQLKHGTGPHYPGRSPSGSTMLAVTLVVGFLLTSSGAFSLLLEKHLLFPERTLVHVVHGVAGWSMLLLLMIHIAFVLWESTLRRENLVTGMITGSKHVIAEGFYPYRESRLRVASALGMIFVMVLFSSWWLRNNVLSHPALPAGISSTAQLSHNPLWEEKCGNCHMPYHPSLLPARSWQEILAPQAEHFGRKLLLSRETVEELLGYALSNAGETGPTAVSRAFMRSIPPGSAPLRITRTQYWLELHGDIPEGQWQLPNVNGPHNCDTCHLEAGKNEYATVMIHLSSAAAVTGDSSQ